MTLTQLTAPAVEPLSLAEAKAWARIDSSAFDSMIPGMIIAARQVAEHELGAKLITQTWRVTFDDWPAGDQLVPLFPATNVALSYWDGATWTALAAGAGVIVSDRFGTYIRPALSTTYPLLVDTVGARVRADVEVGYGATAAEVPYAIRQFIAAHVAFWVRNPEAANDRAMVKSPFLASLLDPFRTYL